LCISYRKHRKQENADMSQYDYKREADMRRYMTLSQETALLRPSDWEAALYRQREREFLFHEVYTTKEYRSARDLGDLRDQEEWYKRRTADRVFAALDVQGLSGAASSSETSHKRKFDVSEVQALLQLDPELRLPGRALRRDRQARYRKD
jgi:hypothetical protein